MSASIPPAADPDGPALGYEQARAELEQVVRSLEGGGVSLEQTVALWERGEALAAICERWLDGAAQQLAASASPEPAEPDDRDG